MQLQRSRRLFRTACITGDLPTVEQLIDEHKHVDLHYFVNHCNNEDGWTCLMYACAHGHREVVQYLVETGGAIVKMRNRWNGTALMIACDRGHLEVVKYLIEKEKQDPNVKEDKSILFETDDDGHTVLMYACDRGRLDVVKYLTKKLNYHVNNRDKLGETALMNACAKGHLDVVKYLIERGAADVTIRSDNGGTLLMRAAAAGHVHIVRYLAGTVRADVNIKDKENKTALMFASQYGHVNVVVYLVEVERAKVNIQDVRGFTALSYAATKGRHLEIVKFLVGPGKAEIQSLATSSGPIQLFFGNKACKDVVVYLADAWKVNANSLTNNQIEKDPTAPALSWACQDGRLDVVKYMVEHWGANVNLKNTSNGMTPLMYACENGQIEVVKYLVSLKDKIKLNSRAKDGETALMKACQFDHRDIAMLLLKTENIDVNIRSPNNTSVLLLAHDYSDKDMLKAVVEVPTYDSSRPLLRVLPCHIAVIGDGGSGKTTLVRRLSNQNSLRSRKDKRNSFVSYSSRVGDCTSFTSDLMWECEQISTDVHVPIYHRMQMKVLDITTRDESTRSLMLKNWAPQFVIIVVNGSRMISSASGMTTSSSSSLSISPPAQLVAAADQELNDRIEKWKDLLPEAWKKDAIVVITHREPEHSINQPTPKQVKANNKQHRLASQGNLIATSGSNGDMHKGSVRVTKVPADHHREKQQQFEVDLTSKEGEKGVNRLRRRLERHAKEIVFTRFDRLPTDQKRILSIVGKLVHERCMLDTQGNSHLLVAEEPLWIARYKTFFHFVETAPQNSGGTLSNASSPAVGTGTTLSVSPFAHSSTAPVGELVPSEMANKTLLMSEELYVAIFRFVADPVLSLHELSRVLHHQQHSFYDHQELHRLMALAKQLFEERKGKGMDREKEVEEEEMFLNITTGFLRFWLESWKISQHLGTDGVPNQVQSQQNQQKGSSSSTAAPASHRQSVRAIENSPWAHRSGSPTGISGGNRDDKMSPREKLFISLCSNAVQAIWRQTGRIGHLVGTSGSEESRRRYLQKQKTKAAFEELFREYRQVPEYSDADRELSGTSQLAVSTKVNPDDLHKQDSSLKDGESSHRPLRIASGIADSLFGGSALGRGNTLSMKLMQPSCELHAHLLSLGPPEFWAEKVMSVMIPRIKRDYDTTVSRKVVNILLRKAVTSLDKAMNDVEHVHQTIEELLFKDFPKMLHSPKERERFLHQSLTVDVVYSAEDLIQALCPNFNTEKVASSSDDHYDEHSLLVNNDLVGTPISSPAPPDNNNATRPYPHKTISQSTSSYGLPQNNPPLLCRSLSHSHDKDTDCVAVLQSREDQKTALRRILHNPYSPMSFDDWYKEYVVFDEKLGKFVKITGLCNDFLVKAMEKDKPENERSETGRGIAASIHSAFEPRSQHGNCSADGAAKNPLQSAITSQYPCVMSFLLNNLCNDLQRVGLTYIEFSLELEDLANKRIAPHLYPENTLTLHPSTLNPLLRLAPDLTIFTRSTHFDYRFLMIIGTSSKSTLSKFSKTRKSNYRQVLAKRYCMTQPSADCSLDSDQLSLFLTRWFGRKTIRQIELQLKAIQGREKVRDLCVGIDVDGDSEGSPFSPVLHREIRRVLMLFHKRNPFFGVRFHGLDKALALAEAGAHNEIFPSRAEYAAHLHILSHELLEMAKLLKRRSNGVDRHNVRLGRDQIFARFIEPLQLQPTAQEEALLEERDDDSIIDDLVPQETDSIGSYSDDESSSIGEYDDQTRERFFHQMLAELPSPPLGALKVDRFDECRRFLTDNHICKESLCLLHKAGASFVEETFISASDDEYQSLPALSYSHSYTNYSRSARRFDSIANTDLSRSMTLFEQLQDQKSTSHLSMFEPPAPGAICTLTQEALSFERWFHSPVLRWFNVDELNDNACRMMLDDIEDAKNATRFRKTKWRNVYMRCRQYMVDEAADEEMLAQEFGERMEYLEPFLRSFVREATDERSFLDKIHSVGPCVIN